MTRTDRSKALAVVAAVALALCLLAWVAVQPAGAAFPGTNGKIVFKSDRSAGPALYTITPGGTATKIPGTISGDDYAAWSPDGSRIAFISGSSTNKEIFVMNADGTGRRQLTATPVAEEEPTWSPDGTRIAFASKDRDEKDPDGTVASDLEIWAINADGNGLTQLTNTTNGVRDTDPAWSPDGERIAFVSEGRVGQFNSDIYVMDANPATNDATNLTPNDTTTNPVYQWNDEDPSWSPDGTHITYSTIQDVWTMTSTGAGKTNLTRGSGGGSDPAWSPDGSKIVYKRSDGTDRNIYVMDTNGADKTPVDTTPRTDQKPDWQPLPPCTLTVNAANDPLTGTAGKDVLCGDGRANTINGADGNDIVRAGAGTDRLAGGAGNDTLDGGSGLDTGLYTGATAVTANLTTGFATGHGSDVLLGVENLTGSGANDRLTGSALPNVLVGGAGADALFGLAGNDTLNSRDRVNGNDSLDGGTGTDTCTRDATERSVRNCP